MAMFTYIVSSFILVLVLESSNVDSINELKVVLIGSNSVAYDRRPFKLICMVLNAASLTDDIEFYRLPDLKPLASVSQQNDKCKVKVKPPSPKYYLHCSRGTNFKEANVKSYKLTINTIVVDDTGQFTCKLKSANIVSRQFTLYLQTVPVNPSAARSGVASLLRKSPLVVSNLFYFTSIVVVVLQYI